MGSVMGSPSQTETHGQASPARTDLFPFEETFVCPRCNRPLALYVQSLHLEVPIDCPRCGRSLTHLIRTAIRQRSV